MKNYLRVLQRGYFLAYRTGILKKNPSYKYHYFVKKLIKKGDVVIDIGANLGYYSKLFSQWVGNSGKVYSVEPISLYNQLFKEITKKCHNITLLPYALGTEEKEIYLVTTTQSGYLNTGLPHVYDEKKDGKFQEQEFTFKAEMRMPSKLFADLKKINYIKCDIEGYEYVVLSQMKDTIAQHRPILQIEVWKENKENIFQLFQSMQYRIYSLEQGKLSDELSLVNAANGDLIFVPEEKTDEINQVI